jgi:hypothetical protein
MPILATGGLVLFRFRNIPPLFSAVIAFPFVYGTLFYFGRAPAFGWYLAPPLWCSMIVGAIGVMELARILSYSRQGVESKRQAILGITMVAVYAWFPNSLVIESFRMQQQNEQQTRMQIGLWLRDSTAQNASVAMEAIGYQGYYCNRRVIDLAGLISPEVISIYKETRSPANAFNRILIQLHPDYLVLRSFEYDLNRHYHGGRLFEQDSQRRLFDSCYVLRKLFAGGVVDHPLSVYGRREVVKR